MNEFLVTINDNKNNSNYSKFVDIPREAKRCYICITKFQGTTETLFTTSANNVVVSLDAAMNVYTNEPNSNIVVPSKIIDVFSTNTYITKTSGEKFAYYNYENNQSNWVEINLSSLSHLRFNFQMVSISDLINPIYYVELPEFPFTLQFKIKFE